MPKQPTSSSRNAASSWRHANIETDLVDIDVRTLNCGQIATALHIAGLPTNWQEMPTSSLIELAQQGIVKIGLDEVDRINTECTRLIETICASIRHPDLDATQERKQLKRMWSSRRNRQQAIDAAWTIFHPKAP